MEISSGKDEVLIIFQFIGIPGTYHYIDVIFYYFSFFFFINPCNSATADIDIHTHRIDREKQKKRKEYINIKQIKRYYNKHIFIMLKKDNQNK